MLNKQETVKTSARWSTRLHCTGFLFTPWRKSWPPTQLSSYNSYSRIECVRRKYLSKSFRVYLSHFRSKYLNTIIKKVVFQRETGRSFFNSFKHFHFHLLQANLVFNIFYLSLKCGVFSSKVFDYQHLVRLENIRLKSTTYCRFKRATRGALTNGFESRCPLLESLGSKI